MAKPGQLHTSTAIPATRGQIKEVKGSTAPENVVLSIEDTDDGSVIDNPLGCSRASNPRPDNIDTAEPEEGIYKPISSITTSGLTRNKNLTFLDLMFLRANIRRTRILIEAGTRDTHRSEIARPNSALATAPLRQTPIVKFTFHMTREAVKSRNVRGKLEN